MDNAWGMHVRGYPSYHNEVALIVQDRVQKQSYI